MKRRRGIGYIDSGDKSVGYDLRMTFILVQGLFKVDGKRKRTLNHKTRIILTLNYIINRRLTLGAWCF
jgi:hypothetical protein